MWCLRSRWTALSHVMRGRSGCLLQSAGGKANRILLASVLSSTCTMCPNGVSGRDWIIAVSLSSSLMEWQVYDYKSMKIVSCDYSLFTNYYNHKNNTMYGLATTVARAIAIGRVRLYHRSFVTSSTSRSNRSASTVSASLKLCNLLQDLCQQLHECSACLRAIHRVCGPWIHRLCNM